MEEKSPKSSKPGRKRKQFSVSVDMSKQITFVHACILVLQ